LRMALLAADQKLINRQTGEIELHGNRYWHPELSARHGEKVTVRFDPDDLHSEIHVYDLEGRYIVAALLIADTGFADAKGAKEAAKREAAYRKRVRDMAEAEQLISAEELADLQAGAKPAPQPQSGVVRPVRQTAASAERAPRQPKKDPAEVLDRMLLGVARKAANN
ncbi:MAG: Mu transposase C-terminal domain-containing protein, partial [Pseudomonadota bacterium]